MTDSPRGAREHPLVPDDSEPASLFYSVESTSEEITRRRARWRVISAVLVSIPFLGLPESTKLRTTVAVVRTSDGSVVESYDYHNPVQASPHVQLLRDRLESMTKAEFESAVGIGS